MRAAAESAREAVATLAENGIGGWEDWMHCGACRCEMFFPVVHRPGPQTPNG